MGIDWSLFPVTALHKLAAFPKRMADLEVAIVGGCCGTTPNHTAAMREALPR
ncbi:MAG TPA: homocysteine S-methyltransferase family protein [Dehalococcoidia bacterium]|nr:homocysteine S-methyltransferase family protein [Dehalococcoidia bacterium]